MAFSWDNEILLPCTKCFHHVDATFYCPTEDPQGRYVQNQGDGQWCLECVGKPLGKYPCSECLELLSRDKFSDNEFVKYRKRECINCSNGPPSGLRDDDLLFRRTFECWICEINMNDYKKYTCSRCQRPTYCSKSCQKRDWITHKKKCQDQSEIAQRMGLLSKSKSSKKNRKKNQQKKHNKQ